MGSSGVVKPQSGYQAVAFVGVVARQLRGQHRNINRRPEFWLPLAIRARSPRGLARQIYRPRFARNYNCLNYCHYHCNFVTIYYSTVQIHTEDGRRICRNMLVRLKSVVLFIKFKLIIVFGPWFDLGLWHMG